MWPFDWKNVLTALVTAVLVYFGRGLVESRRRIRFSAPRVYFGPALTYNLFMGRNYPSEKSISLECTNRFFSEKAQTVGLHDFQLEFCRKQRFRTVVEFAPDMQHVLKDLNTKDGVGHLDTLELPSRKFVSFELTSDIERRHWPKLQSCTLARLSCRTADGRLRRFTIGAIQMPAMPPEGVDGTEYMSVQVMPKNWRSRPDTKSLLIMATRRRNMVGSSRLSEVAQEDTRYWNGTVWVTSEAQAKIYASTQDAHNDGEPIQIWNKVPEEWMERGTGECGQRVERG